MNIDCVEILSFRLYLQNLLNQYIERELFKIRKKIKFLIKKTEVTIEALKKEKSIIKYLRMFLFRLAICFYNFIVFALNSIYYKINSVFFSDYNNDKHSTKFRVLIYFLNIDFSNYIKQNRQKCKIIERKLNIDCNIENIFENNQLLVIKSEIEI